MIVDSSALVSILLKEPDRDRVYDALTANTKKRFTIPVVRLETVLNIATRRNIPLPEAEEAFDRLLEVAEISTVPIIDSMGRLAVETYARYGKGFHPAKLNFGDCMVYAAARHYRAALLFIGNDFSQTDISGVLADPAPTARG